MNLLIRVNRYLLRKAIRILNGLLKLSEKLNVDYSMSFASLKSQLSLVQSASKYDMFAASGESYYADQYWQLIEDFMPLNQKEVQIVDLGCGQGRMVQKFLDNFPTAEIRCCDISGKAISDLYRNIALSPGQQVKAEVSEIGSFLSQQISSSADIVIFTEVTFYFPGWETCLSDIYRILKPGGVFVSSHRSRYFNAMLLLSLGHIYAAERILKNNSGRLFGTTDLQFSWNDSSAAREILVAAGFSVNRVAGIGVLSGIKGDPLELLADPGKLSAVELTALMELEKQLSETVPDSGRYVLFIAKKD
jgi:SAM-dependent methyltransferase